MRKTIFTLCMLISLNCFSQKFQYDTSNYISLADSAWVEMYGVKPDTTQAKIMLYDTNNNLKLVDGYVIFDHMQIRYLNYMRKPFNKNYKVYSFKSIWD